MKIHSFLSVLMEGYKGKKERKNGSSQVHKLSLKFFKCQYQHECPIDSPHIYMHLKGNALHEHSHLVCIMIFHSARRDYMVITKRGNNLFFCRYTTLWKSHRAADKGVPFERYKANFRTTCHIFSGGLPFCLQPLCCKNAGLFIPWNDKQVWILKHIIIITS